MHRSKRSSWLSNLLNLFADSVEPVRSGMGVEGLSLLFDAVFCFWRHRGDGRDGELFPCARTCAHRRVKLECR